MIRHSADRDESPVLSSNRAADVLIESFLNQGRDEWVPVPGAKNNVVGELCEAPHDDSLLSPFRGCLFPAISIRGLPPAAMCCRRFATDVSPNINT